MKVDLVRTAAEFVERTEQLRAADPFRTNIIGSVASSVANGTRTYEKFFWWVISDEAGEVVGAAMRTAPHGMLLSPMPIEATAKLAVAVSEHDLDFTEVAGPVSVIEEFLEAYRATDTSQSRREVEESGHELLYTLESLTIPSVKGSIENAKRDELKKIYAWLIDFGNEAGLLIPNPTESIEDGFNRDSWRFWRVDGEIVSFAGHAALVETPSGRVGRIGPVYTPPIYRRRGYAGILTAMLSQQLIDQGARVMLYTDAKNPTSNSVYQRIGFTLLGENKRFKFVE